jgi:hyperosmotically inducible periplasmic protein
MIAALAVSVASCGGTADRPGETVSANDADNTARNERDQNEATKTPLDQSENSHDVEITANVRKAIVADDSLSTNAHNVKVITSGGVVTLRGPVKSAHEKTTIEMKAKQVAGVTRVENQLEIEADSK